MLSWGRFAEWGNRVKEINIVALRWVIGNE